MKLFFPISFLSAVAIMFQTYDQLNSFPMPDAIETYYDAMGDLYVVTANEGANPMMAQCSREVCPGGPGEFEEVEIGEEFIIEGEDSSKFTSK